MSQFKKFADQVAQQFNQIQLNGVLFTSSVTGNDLWDIYIKGFKKEDDPVFRDPESSTHNCNLDKNFIRRYGNVVSIDSNFNIVTMWDVDLPEDSPYYRSAYLMSKVLRASLVTNVFIETFDELKSLPYETVKKNQEVYRLGIPVNHKIYTQEEVDKFGVVKTGQTYQFNHFYGDLDKKFVDFSGKSQAAIIGEYRDAKDVFKRGLEQISIDTFKLVRDLINQESLLDGKSHLHKINALIPLSNELNDSPYTKSIVQSDNWFWLKSHKLPYAKFRNELIGTLCVELSEGKELNEACKTWNKRVDPANYMKAKAPITANQIKQAQEFVEENGYTESFNRRFASLHDINVDEILHSNVGDGKIKTASIFDSVKSTASTSRHKRSQFDGIEEVGIEKFMKDILPTCTSIEAFVENRMEGNLVALTTANIPDSKKMFKWNNNFSWTFKGNLAGKSQIKENVKAKGGEVDGVLRCSLVWNDVSDTKSKDHSDLDLWCKQPDKQKIGYDQGYRKDSGNKFTSCEGQLDLDDRGYSGNIHVENIYFKQINKLKEGTYEFWVHQFGATGSKGFKAEIEFNGNIYSYEYLSSLSTGTNVKLANVIFKNGNFEIEHLLPVVGESNKSIWNLETNEFHKVNLVCVSPNHWGDNNIGNKHYLFMLDKCKTDESIRSFHNENLNSDLLAHRKVTEVLANTTMIEPLGDQLSGLGFNATMRDEMIVKLAGSHKRTIKIKF